MKFATILFFIGTIAAIRVTTHNEAEDGAITDDQVKQFQSLSQKLGLEMTEDMMVGQSAEDVSNAIIGAALESGKSQEEVEAAMGGQWAQNKTIANPILPSGRKENIQEEHIINVKYKTSYMNCIET